MGRLLDVNFVGQSPLDIDKWTWSFGDGDSASAQTAAHTFDQPGLWDVSLQVESGLETYRAVHRGCVAALAIRCRPTAS